MEPSSRWMENGYTAVLGDGSHEARSRQMEPSSRWMED